MIFSICGTGCLSLHQFVVGFSGVCCQRSFDNLVLLKFFFFFFKFNFGPYLSFFFGGFLSKSKIRNLTVGQQDWLELWHNDVAGF